MEKHCVTCHVDKYHDDFQEVKLKLYYCGACRRVRYCSKECQAADWRDHKTNCYVAPKRTWSRRCK